MKFLYLMIFIRGIVQMSPCRTQLSAADPREAGVSEYDSAVSAIKNKTGDPLSYRLHDIWVLESVNDRILNTKDFTKGLPLLELNLTKNKVIGHTGCNQMNGIIEVKGMDILFGALSAMELPCNVPDFETRYVNSLSRRSIPYNIEAAKLYLKINGDSTFIYRKID